MFYLILEACLFGDQPANVANENKTCYELIVEQAQHFYCYLYEEQCCNTCATVATSYTSLTSKYTFKQNCTPKEMISQTD